MTPILPSTDWTTLLQRAPGFSAVLMDALCNEAPSKFPPHIRTFYYYDLFDAQVSNGGVDQYFSNMALCLRDFARVPEFIAQNTVFEHVLPMVRQAHAIWDEIAPAYAAAGGEGEGDEEEEEVGEEEHEEEAPSSIEVLLAPYAARLEAIAKSFFAIHHNIRQSLEADIVRDPHRYFKIEAVPGLRGAGIEHITLDEGASRLRFEDGFPVGPNILEREDGSCDVVRFSRDRQLLQAETADFLGNRIQHWIHYPSQASGRWSFNFARDAGRVMAWLSREHPNWEDRRALHKNARLRLQAGEGAA